VPISITEHEISRLCWNWNVPTGTGSSLRLWRSTKLEQLGYPWISKSKRFCLNCQKHWNLAGTCCNFDKWSPLKLFRLPTITKQLLTFQPITVPRLQASMISSTDWLYHNHHSSCAQSIRFSWTQRYHSFTLRHKLDVLCHKFLKDISPRIAYVNSERLTTSIHVLAMRSRAACWRQTST